MHIHGIRKNSPHHLPPPALLPLACLNLGISNTAPMWPHVLFTLTPALCTALVSLALVIQAQLSSRTSPWKSPPGVAQLTRCTLG